MIKNIILEGYNYRPVSDFDTFQMILTQVTHWISPGGVKMTTEEALKEVRLAGVSK